MSLAHTRRRKTIRRFKKQYGKTWHNHFAEHCAQIRRNMLGPCLGSLADLVSPGSGGLAGTRSDALPVST